MQMKASEANLLLEAIYKERSDEDRELGRFLKSSKGKGVQPVLEIGTLHHRK